MRHSIFLATAILTAFALSASVFAHPGNTDGKGGHYNQSTGEYHYHHGYPAHGHSDMDGNGDEDCPYLFKRVESDTYPHNTIAGISTATEAPTEATQATFPVLHEDRQPAPDLTWFYIAIGFGFLAVVLASCLLEKSRDYRQLSNMYLDNLCKKKRAEQDLESTRENCKNTVKELTERTALQVAEAERKASLVAGIANSYMPALQRQAFMDACEEYTERSLGIPEKVYFSERGVPLCGSVTYDRPFGEFTVYVTRAGSCFHKSKSCCGRGAISVHVFTASKHFAPCSNCVGPGFEMPEWASYIPEVAFSEDQ